MLPSFRAAVRRKLRLWYKKHKRDLPWRRTSDPYAVWIAETMLQQTQVMTVIPYYEIFLRAFPTAEALARAPLQRVLRHWSGLGYYRRAENLSRAARQISRRYGGKIPDRYDDLRGLPGIGDYTAGAVLSIAFSRRYPAMDGNVRRVLGRLMRIENERDLRSAAAALVPKSGPGEFNQALMELGATLCTPKHQRCRDCPLDAVCESGSRAGPLNALVPSKKRTVVENMTWPLAVVRRGSTILLHRRSGDGLLAGLWNLPGGELTGNMAATAVLRQRLSGLKLGRVHPLKIGEIRHAMTRWRIRAPIYLFDLNERTAVDLPDRRWRWIRPSRIAEQATSAMTKKAVALLSRREETSL